MDDILNVGIIGCGSIARQRHAHEYTLNPHARIVGVQDFSAERAQSMIEKFGGRVYATAQDLLADPEIDAVSICAANKYHAELAVAALNAGKHVLCEKPMAVTLSDCEAMLAAARASGKRLLIGQNQRLAATHVKAKELLDSGALGRVISFQTTFGHRGPETWSIEKSADTWFFKKDAASFGSMADLGIHKIDLMRYLIGGKVRSVFATLATLDKTFSDGSPIEVDDNSVELLTFDSGALGTVTTSWTHYGQEQNSSVLYCEKGIMKLYNDPTYSLQIVYADGTEANYKIDRLQTNEDAQQTTSGVIDEFVNAVLHGTPSVLDAEDIFESMQVVFACLASSEKMAVEFL